MNATGLSPEYSSASGIRAKFTPMNATGLSPEYSSASGIRAKFTPMNATGLSPEYSMKHAQTNASTTDAFAKGRYPNNPKSS